jgi:hypothetical protein
MKLLLILFLPCLIVGKDLPFKKDRIYTYKIITMGKESGFSKFSLNDTLVDKRPCIAIEETLYVKNPSMEISGSAVIVYTPLGKPLYYSGISNYDVQEDREKSGLYQVSIRFIKDGANVEVIRNGQPFLKTGIPISENIFHTIEGNHLGQFSVTLFFINDLLTTAIKRKVLHIGSYKLVDLELRLIRFLELQTEKRIVPCKKVEYLVAGRRAGTLWISDKGMLIKDKEQGGDLIIELEE